VSDTITIAVISFAMRREHGFPESETYVVLRGDQPIATDRDKPECIAPVQWARDMAAHLGVPFVEPGPTVNFAMHHNGTWFAYHFDQSVYEREDNGDGWVLNPYAAQQPAIVFSTRRLREGQTGRAA
jgi:hypothetical protein